MITDVYIHNLVCHEDERGDLTELYKDTTIGFAGFAQIYVTRNDPGIIRAWHFHKQQTDNWTVVTGRILVGLYDARENSITKGETMRFILSEKSMKTVSIPPGVWHGYKTLGLERSLLLNLTSEHYNTEDEFRIPSDEITAKFDWNKSYE